MTVTDFITFFLSALFLLRGASRGFMKSLMVPLSIIVAMIISIIYYQITEDIIISSLIGLIGPLFINLLLKFLLKTWATATNTDIKPTFVSRLGGSILTLTWGWVFIIFTLILLAVLPPWGKPLTAIQNDVTKSASYCIAKPFGESIFSVSRKNIPATSNAALSAEAKLLAADPRFHMVLQDPDIQKEIEAHDLVKLMSNPKMIYLTQQIMSDPATMKKVMAIYSHQAPAQISFTDVKPTN
jgi:uncharacterized membrane protein required for colicin V production